MQAIRVRFFNRDTREMRYDLGISPGQEPLALREDGTYGVLEGSWAPMLCTLQGDADRKVIWEGDVLECGVQVAVGELASPVLLKHRGLMRYNREDGAFILQINSNPEQAGQKFQVVEARVIGDIFTQPDLMQPPK
jgi:hypothetical protein